MLPMGAFVVFNRIGCNLVLTIECENSNLKTQDGPSFPAAMECPSSSTDCFSNASGFRSHRRPSFRHMRRNMMRPTKSNLILVVMVLVAALAGIRVWAQTATGRVVGNVSDTQ